MHSCGVVATGDLQVSCSSASGIVLHRGRTHLPCTKQVKAAMSGETIQIGPNLYEPRLVPADVPVRRPIENPDGLGGPSGHGPLNQRRKVNSLRTLGSDVYGDAMVGFVQPDGKK